MVEKKYILPILVYGGCQSKREIDNFTEDDSFRINGWLIFAWQYLPYAHVTPDHTQYLVEILKDKLDSSTWSFVAERLEFQAGSKVPSHLVGKWWWDPKILLPILTICLFIRPCCIKLNQQANTNTRNTGVIWRITSSTKNHWTALSSTSQTTMVALGTGHHGPLIIISTTWPWPLHPLNTEPRESELHPCTWQHEAFMTWGTGLAINH